MAPNANRMSPNFGDSARDDRSSSSSLLSTRKYYVKRSLNSMQFAIENSCANNGGDGDGDSLKDCQSVLLAQAKAAQQKSKDKLLARDKQQQQQRTMQKKLWTARKQQKQNKTSSSILDQLVVIEPNPTQTFERLPPPPPSLPIPTLSNLPYHLTRGDGSNSTFHTLDGVTTDTVHSMMRKDDVARLARRLHALQKQHQKQLRRHKQTKRQPKRCGTPFRHCTLETYTCGAFWTGGVEEESCIHTRTNCKSRLSPRKESLVANELAALQARLRQLRTNNKKCVRFEAPLVTKVYTRPKTHPDDIDHLYFQEDELDLLEEDRERVPADKVECHYYNYSSLSSSSSSNSQKNAHAHIRVESGVRHPQDE